MKSRPSLQRFVVVLALGLALVLVPGLARPVRAATEDAALFYETLAPYGEWIYFEKYGPVWYPTQVESGWRPYVNGRWVPTEQGYIFETAEPWGWATYHYGNWMPTDGYGWVWVPGHTWYPSTVVWRTSDDYVGWAPIPPSDYSPSLTLAFYPAGTYYSGMPVDELLVLPFWTFVRAPHFLLGFGQPFSPFFSFATSGFLAPPVFVPVFFHRTVFLTNFVVNPFFPNAFFAFGPPFPFAARVSGISPVALTTFVQSVNLMQINNAVPAVTILNQNVVIRQIVPTALVQGQPLPAPQPVQNVTLAQANLVGPHVAPLPKGVVPLGAQIPWAAKGTPPPGKGIAAMGLPGKAIHPLTPQMGQEIKKLPPSRGIVPTQPAAPPSAQVVKPPGPAPQPAAPPQPAPPRQAQVQQQPEVIRGLKKEGTTARPAPRTPQLPGQPPPGPGGGQAVSPAMPPGKIVPQGIPPAVPQVKTVPPGEPQVIRPPQPQPRPEPQAQPRPEPQAARPQQAPAPPPKRLPREQPEPIQPVAPPVQPMHPPGKPMHPPGQPLQPHMFR